MILIDAMSLLDGGITAITVIRAGKQETFSIDCSLPWDGRTRYVFRGEAFQKDVDSIANFRLTRLFCAEARTK